MKVYKVNVYSVGHSIGSLGELNYLDTILVRKDFFGVDEIITKVLMKEWEEKEENTLVPSHMDFDMYNKYGYVLAIRKKDLQPKNLATMDDLDKYLNSFSESKFKKVIDDMKILSDKECKMVNKKVKALDKLGK